MIMKKTALATAVAFALAGNPVWATTTTTSGKFILDKTEVPAGGAINLALVGLEESGEVDRYAEQGGYTIVATVSSEKGTVVGGTKHPDEITSSVGAGQFALTVSYVKLVQGNGRVNIYYPPETTGEDTVKIKLQARSGSANSGYTYVDIPNASTTKTITIVPADTVPVKLDIMSFTPAPDDTAGVADTDTTGGIDGKMTAGKQGAMIEVRGMTATEKASNTSMTEASTAAGDIKLTVKKGAADKTDVVYTQKMVKGVAKFVLDNKVVRADKHYIEASVGDVMSVDLLEADTLEVLPTGIPKAIKLESAYGQTAVLNADFDKGACKELLACQGIKIKVSAVDAFGNKTHDTERMKSISAMATPSTTSAAITLKIEDNKTSTLDKVIADDALDVQIDPATGDGMARTKDLWIGNAKGELLKNSEAHLIATPIDTTGQPLSTVAASGELVFNAVKYGINSTINASFTVSPLAGTEVKSAMTVSLIDAEGNPNSVQPASLISVTNLTSKEKVDVRRQTEAGKENHVDLLFMKATNSTSTYKTDVSNYLVGDAAGNYGQVVLSNLPGITIGALTDVTMVNGHGYEISSIDPGRMTTEKTYVVQVPQAIFKMTDSHGNKVTTSATKDVTGEFSISSSNGSYMQARNNTFGVPGSTDTAHATVTYEAAGEKPFSGEDSIAVSFTKPGLGSKQLSVATTIPKLQDLSAISTYIEQTEIPINSEVAMTVEVLDQDGKPFKDPDSTKNTVVKVSIQGTGENPIPAPTVREIKNGQEYLISDGDSLNFNETGSRKVFIVSAGPVEGEFTISFADANNKISSGDSVFKVTRILEDKCSENNLVACTKDTDPTCEDAGGFYDEDATICRFVPMIEEGVAGIGKDGKPITSAAKIRGGCSVNGADISNGVVAGLTTPMKLIGTVEADPAHVGKEADILFLAETTDAAGNSFFYSVYTQGLEANTDEDPADGSNGFNDFSFEGFDFGLRMFMKPVEENPEEFIPAPLGDENIDIANYEPFRTTTLKPRQAFQLFNWDGGVGQVGAGKFFTGYRLKTGEVIFNVTDIACAAAAQDEPTEE